MIEKKAYSIKEVMIIGGYSSYTPIITLEKRGKIHRLDVPGVRYSKDEVDSVFGIKQNRINTEFQDANCF